MLEAFKPWVSYVGDLESYSAVDHHISLKMNNKGCQMHMEPELAGMLDETMVGRTIAILHTDLPGKPYCVRVVEGLLTDRPSKGPEKLT